MTALSSRCASGIYPRCLTNTHQGAWTSDHHTAHCPSTSWDNEQDLQYMRLFCAKGICKYFLIFSHFKACNMVLSSCLRIGCLTALKMKGITSWNRQQPDLFVHLCVKRWGITIFIYGLFILSVCVVRRIVCRCEKYASFQTSDAPGLSALPNQWRNGQTAISVWMTAAATRDLVGEVEIYLNIA